MDYNVCSADPLEPISSTTDELTCSYFVERKNRFCKMLTKRGNIYCGQHQPSVNTVEDASSSSDRIICPLDKRHSCYVSSLDKHLKKCNKSLKDTRNFIKIGINAGVSSSNLVPRMSLSQLSDDKLLSLINKINKAAEVYVPEINEEIKYHEVLEEELRNPIYGETKKKHLLQAASLLCLYEKYNLIKDGTMFIEFGAGKGQLSYWLKKIVKDSRKRCSILLVDRANCRHKFDDRKQISNDFSVPVRRVKADIADIDLANEELKLSEFGQIVASSKHLCGAGTDLALRGISSLKTNDQLMEKCVGVITATCCHHRCDQVSFVGLSFLLEKGFTLEEFNIMCSLSSWATSGERKNPSICAAVDYLQRYAVLNLSQEQRRLIGRNCKHLLDYTRLLYLEQLGFCVRLVSYISESISPENVCILATRT